MDKFLRPNTSHISHRTEIDEGSTSHNREAQPQTMLHTSKDREGQVSEQRQVFMALIL